MWYSIMVRDVELIRYKLSVTSLRIDAFEVVEPSFLGFSVNDVTLALVPPQLLNVLNFNGNNEDASLTERLCDEIHRWLRTRLVALQSSVLRSAVKYNAVLSKLVPLEWLQYTLGLSLSDCAWVKPTDSRLEWCDVSLYSHPVYGRVVSDALRGRLVPTLGEVELSRYLRTPDIATCGGLLKFWRADNGLDSGTVLARLYKTSDFSGIQEIFQESVVSLVSQYFLDVGDFVKYTLYANGGKTTNLRFYTYSEAFTSERVMFTSMSDLFIKYDFKAGSLSNMLTIVDNECNDAVMANTIKQKLGLYLVLDYIVGNEGRTYSKLGLLRDTGTGIVLGLAPSFDMGKSLLWRYRDVTITDAHFFSLAKVKDRSRDVVKAVKQHGLLSYDDVHERVHRIMDNRGVICNVMQRELEQCCILRSRYCFSARAKVQTEFIRHKCEYLLNYLL